MRTFLDSNVLMSAFKGQEEISRRAFEVLGDGQRVFVGSDFLRLELLPKAEYHGNADEVAFYEAYFASVVEVIETTPGRVSEASELARRYGLSGPDSLLARAAIAGGAREFVTAERASKPLFRIPVGDLMVRSIRPTEPRPPRWKRFCRWLCTWCS